MGEGKLCCAMPLKGKIDERISYSDSTALASALSV
jgi:hypothetical protein